LSQDTTTSAFPVTVTEDAARHISRLVQRKGGPGSFFRIGVKGGGCSGLEYMMKLDTELRDTDLEIEAEGIKIVCDPKSAQFLQDSVLVFTGNLLGGGLSFENPNAERSCGCGTSFTPRSVK
jgi:iron-sulfur cluster assembly protein